MQFLIDGVCSGTMLALVAAGIGLAYQAIGCLPLALGGIYAIAPFIVWSCLQSGLHWMGAGIASLSACFLLGVACETGKPLATSRKRGLCGRAPSLFAWYLCATDSSDRARLGKHGQEPAPGHWSRLGRAWTCADGGSDAGCDLRRVYFTCTAPYYEFFISRTPAQGSSR